MNSNLSYFHLSPARATGSRPWARAFSMIELLVVMALMSVLAGVSVPALKGLMGSNGLNSGVRQFSNLLVLARSEAISRHTLVRFLVAQDWSGKAEANLRKASLWAWDAEVEQFRPLTAWEELPTGIVVEPSLPDYVRTAAYATDDAASVRGACVLAENFASAAGFEAGTNAEKISTRYIEFTPSGRIRIPGSVERNAIFVATHGFTKPDGSLTYTSRSGNQPTNWAQINVDALTGRVRIYQP